MGETEEKVRSVLAKSLGVELEAVTTDANIIEDLGADSLDTVQIQIDLEQAFNLEYIEDAEAEKFRTVQDVVSYIEKATGELDG